MSRRIELIARVLRGFGFGVAVRGDLITGRVANMPREEMLQVLDQVGRLIAYTRQLDAVLHDDRSVETHVGKFLAVDYSLYT